MKDEELIACIVKHKVQEFDRMVLNAWQEALKDIDLELLSDEISIINMIDRNATDR